MQPHERWDAAVMVSPLAVMVRGVVEWTFPPGSFAELFGRYAPGQTTRTLTVDSLVGLMIDVVTGIRPSVYAAYVADQNEPTPTLTATHQAVYAKLGRLAPAFSAALVRRSGERLGSVLAAAGRTRCPGWAGYRVRILDGTDLAGTEHRLAVLRRIHAAGLPGRLVVEYDVATGLVVDVSVSEDAYTSERVLVKRILEQTRANDVYVADRHYCTTEVMFGIDRRRGRFVIREHEKLRTQVLRKARGVGRVATGEVWEQPIMVEDPATGERRPVRRLILKLDTPNREGETEIRILTNLRKKVTAVRIVALYRQRWTLERHFDFLKNCLNGQIESLGEPRAALFAMSMAMVAGNAVAVVKQALATAHGTAEFAKLSGYYLADEIRGHARAVAALIEPQQWEELARQPAPAFWPWCLRLARQVRTAALHTHPRGPKKPKPHRRSGKQRPHYSTYRLKNEAKTRC